MGSSVSMASDGRILWELDEKGYVGKVSNKGRILSSSGQEYLEKLEAEGKSNTLAQELLEELYMRTPRDLLDILVARRAFERETARLAAINATKDDLIQIKAFAEILDGERDQIPSISVIDLPDDIAWRKKEQFDEGSGVIDLLRNLADKYFEGNSWKQYHLEHPDVMLRSAEECMYHRLFRRVFCEPPAMEETVARWSVRPVFS